MCTRHLDKSSNWFQLQMSDLGVLFIYQCIRLNIYLVCTLLDTPCKQALMLVVYFSIGQQEAVACWRVTHLLEMIVTVCKTIISSALSLHRIKCLTLKSPRGNKHYIKIVLLCPHIKSTGKAFKSSHGWLWSSQTNTTEQCVYIMIHSYECIIC